MTETPKITFGVTASAPQAQHSTTESSITRPSAPETCGRRWVAEIELCVRCGLDAEAHAKANARPVTDDDADAGCRAEHPADRLAGSRCCVRWEKHTQHIDVLGRCWTDDTDVVLRPGEEGRIPEVALAWHQAHRERDHLIELEAAVALTLVISEDDCVSEPTPVEWVDGQGDVWREDPADPERVKVVFEGKEGLPVPRSDYQDRAYVAKMWGGLRRRNTQDNTEMSRRHAPTTVGSTVVKVLPDGSTVVDVIDDDDTETYLDGRLISQGASVDQRKIVAAADALEDILVMMSQAVQDLRDVDTNPHAPTAYGAPSDRAAAYARLYFLRRELGRVVATLGAELPPSALLKGVERDYRAQVQEITEFEERADGFGR